MMAEGVRDKDLPLQRSTDVRLSTLGGNGNPSRVTKHGALDEVVTGNVLFISSVGDLNSN